MEQLPSDYAEHLHENGLKPFSQYLSVYGDDILWTISCLNDECADKLGNALMRGMDTVYIRNKNIALNVLKKNVSTLPYKSFIDNTYFSKSTNHSLEIAFITATAFKADGRYKFFPDLESIYSNLIRKFDAFSTEYKIYDEDMLNSLLLSSYIAAYNLRSTVFHMESVIIPAFTGWIRIKIKGSDRLANLARMIFKYGEYSGIGIKTALGMGAVKIKEDVSNEGK